MYRGGDYIEGDNVKILKKINTLKNQTHNINPINNLDLYLLCDVSKITCNVAPNFT